MKPHIGFCLALLVGFVHLAPASAEPPPIAAFARLPAVRNVTLSPDGKYLAFVSGVGDREAVVTIDRTSGKTVPVLHTAEHDPYSVRWCRWANDTRLLCGMRSVAITDPGVGSMRRIKREVTYVITQLIAVDADGKRTKLLFDNVRTRYAQFQDRVLDIKSDRADEVLVAVETSNDGRYGHNEPAVLGVNIYTGEVRNHLSPYKQITSYISDGRGNVRLGSGCEYRTCYYYARLTGENEWQRLAKIDAFPLSAYATALGVVPETNYAYAIANHDGYDALWKIDLAEKEEPQVVFAQAGADVQDAVFTDDGILEGVRYDTTRPAVYYLDEKNRDLVKSLDRLLPNAVNELGSASRDGKVRVVVSYSDQNAGTYYTLDRTSGKAELKLIGAQYPELAQQALGDIRDIEYRAADGTTIHGYLTVPSHSEAKHLPLVVMPHDGPIARDSAQFDTLRLFLASRGYAVLQMNFRGSGGYGWDWFRVAHQDWGGLTYSDITDGARWAVAQGIADPHRIAIAGWGFGGYAALLGAVRNSDLYRCAISIAGISDLIQLDFEYQPFLNRELMQEQVGTDIEKLRADSPRGHADEIKIPVLLVHGDHDEVADMEQAKIMNSALEWAKKPHEFVRLKGATHALHWPSDRSAMLKAVEDFLAHNLAEHRD